MACVLAVLGGVASSAIASERKSSRREVLFTGMCDASGAVPISKRLFAIADDEDNVLRIYDADVGGAPLSSYDMSASIDALKTEKKEKKKKKRRKPPKGIETDIEAATRIGDMAVWLTSHGRSTSGVRKPARLRFFATTVSEPISLIGSAYDTLLEDLLASPSLTGMGLEAAALLPVKAGGLNLEGMTATPDGGILIGFREPLFEGKAIVVLIQNPTEMVRGARPRLAAPSVLNLGGGGVRGISWWRGKYLIASGAEGHSSRLFSWTLEEGVRPLASIDLVDFDAEAFFTPEERSEVLVFSDDGRRPVEGRPCKKVKDRSKKSFRGRWVDPSDDPAWPRRSR